MNRLRGSAAKLAVLLAVVALIAAACSSEDAGESTSTTTQPQTTTSAEPAAPASTTTSPTTTTTSTTTTLPPTTTTTSGGIVPGELRFFGQADDFDGNFFDHVAQIVHQEAEALLVRSLEGSDDLGVIAAFDLERRVTAFAAEVDKHRHSYVAFAQPLLNQFAAPLRRKLVQKLLEFWQQVLG